jgi:hypothetical protein
MLQTSWQKEPTNPNKTEQSKTGLVNQICVENPFIHIDKVLVSGKPLYN